MRKVTEKMRREPLLLAFVVVGRLTNNLEEAQVAGMYDISPAISLLLILIIDFSDRSYWQPFVVKGTL